MGGRLRHSDTAISATPQKTKGHHPQVTLTGNSNALVEVVEHETVAMGEAGKKAKLHSEKS